MSFLDKLQQIDELKSKIDAFGEFSPEIKKRINYKFRLDWNYYSNSIEGGTLTKEETRSVMIGNVEIHGKSIKDVVEMRGHDGVVNEILKVGKGEVRLSEKRIKEIHKSIMYEENPELIRQIGIWKKDANEIINYRGEKFEFSSPEEVSELIHKLLDVTNAAIDNIKSNKKGAIHPVELAIKFHLDFVAIHPFYDGNGRMARILTNLLLISFGYPPFVVNESDKERYNQLLADIQGYEGAPDLFYEFLADLEIKSLELILDVLNGKDISELSDLDKKLKLLDAELNIKGNDWEKKIKLDSASFEIIKSEMLDYLLLGILNVTFKFNKYYRDFQHTISWGYTDPNKDVGFSEFNFSIEDPEFILNKFYDSLNQTYGSINKELNANDLTIYIDCEFEDSHFFESDESCKTHLYIILEEFLYKVEFTEGDEMSPADKIIERPYHKLPTKKELDGIILKWGNYLYEFIERHKS